MKREKERERVRQGGIGKELESWNKVHKTETILPLQSTQTLCCAGKSLKQNCNWKTQTVKKKVV